MDIKKEKRNHAEWFKGDDPVAFSLVYSSQEYERDFLLSERTWLAARAQAVPEGFVLIKNDTKTVVAIERMVEQQVEASGMDSRRLERLDGWKIIEAAIEAQEQNQ